MNATDLFDLLKGIGSSAAIGCFLLLLGMRDKVADHERELYGKDGKNGHRGDLKVAKAEIAALKEWRTREEAIAQIEEELMKDTGRVPERMRDKLRE
jgi:hypothetical protein